MKTLFVLLLLAGAADDETPRKQSAIAPSLKALSKDEEARIDAVIERFVRADLGRLKGPDAKQAIKDFEALPPEAIPAMIHALNAAAKANQSCPVLMITKKLSRMLLASEDDKLLEFARDEIGSDGADRSAYANSLKDLRFQILLRKNALARAPRPKPPEPKGLAATPTADLARLASTRRGKDLAAVVAELGKRDGRDALAGLAVAASDSDADVVRQARAALAAHVGRLAPEALAAHLDGDVAELRRAAVRPASKHARLVPKVIDRVEDESADVRAEARSALVALSKGADHGPEADASREARGQAKRKWSDWWRAR